jgi:hypothetical protein
MECEMMTMVEDAVDIGTFKMTSRMSLGFGVAAKWKPPQHDDLWDEAYALGRSLLRKVRLPVENATLIVRSWIQEMGEEITWDQTRGLVQEAEDDDTPIKKLKEIGIVPMKESEYIDIDDKVEWLWDGYLAKGCITQLVGDTTVGKTSLNAWLCWAMNPSRKNMSLGTAIKPGKILYLTEEDRMIWKERLSRFPDGHLGDHVEFLYYRTYFDSGIPDMDQWVEFCELIGSTVRDRGTDLVIMDPWQTFNPVQDENDAGATKRCMVHLKAITEAGAALNVSGHTRKMKGKFTSAGRGSSALAGFADILLMLDEFSSHEEDTRRKITGRGRVGKTVPSLVIDYDPETSMYEAKEGQKAPDKKSRERDVLAILADSPVPMTLKMILGSWKPFTGQIEPKERTLYGDLKRLVTLKKLTLSHVPEEGSNRMISAFNIPPTSAPETVSASAAGT